MDYLVETHSHFSSSILIRRLKELVDFNSLTLHRALRLTVEK